jgi:hypothetical protein
MRPGGIGGLDVGWRARVFGGAAALLLVLGCKPQFEGPYPCKPGYASCARPADPAGATCETNTTADGLNCGACGVACGVGAACVASHCGQAAVQLATLSADPQTQLETNSTAVFWHDSTNIYTLPASAGANATPTKVTDDLMTCNGAGRVFGVDDANVYYWSNGFNCNTPNACAGLIQLSLADSTRTVLVPAPMTGSFNNCGSFAVGATSVYMLVGQQKGNATTYTIYAAQIGVAGQTPTSIATAQSYNGSSTGAFALNSTSLIFETRGTNNMLALQVLPLAGGPMTTLPINIVDYGFFSFAVDDANVYGIAAGCPCGGNNGNNQQNGTLPPTGTVVKAPFDGRPSTVLATVSGQVGGIAVDATHVYWSTDTSAWKVPIAGAAAAPVAGNLSNGQAPFKCTTCGGGGQQNQFSAIAVSASGLYIAVTGPAENALLEVAK